MKRTFNKFSRGEKGQVLILVLILMLFGGLIITPLLSYMATGLIVGKEVYEERMDELYAADAGVEDAIWQIRWNPTVLPGDGDPPLTYSIADVNGKTIEVTIECTKKGVAGGTYIITSVATSDDGSSTTIESKVLTFPLLWTNAAISVNTIDVYPGTEVNGPLYEYYDPNKWPFGQGLSDFYLSQMGGAEIWTSDTLDVATKSTFGPLYRDGDLTIINTGSAGATATLSGTVYVTGKLTIGATNQDFTLDLNYNTIYCHANPAPPAYAITIGGKCTLMGSGCIVAVGSIYFQPKMSSDDDDFIFVMSISGEVQFQPNGNFWGSIAGNTIVDLHPGNITTLPDIEAIADKIDQLNFPMEDVESAVKIRTWEIILGSS